jgi:aspartate/methionine/tyrosine aminotransferase
MFEKYINSVLNSKMLEVCSTTLPQLVLPKLLSHPKYPDYLNERISRYEKYSNISYDCLRDIDGILVNRTNGAFYLSIAFEASYLTDKQTLPIANSEVRKQVENLVNQPGVSFDKRFVYYLLGSTGICTVPLTSFATDLPGIRVTMLERDEAAFREIIETIAQAIRDYLAS